MAFAITQTCCADASCVSVCPVNCIRPTPQERSFGSTEMLHIDPSTCIDCGACADACPTDAIFPVDRLAGPDQVYAQINADYFADGLEPAPATPSFPPAVPAGAPLSVAVVGTGPAAGYTLESLLPTGVWVTMYDKLDTPGGLLKYGVAPDHLATRRMDDRFAALRRHPRVRLQLGTEVGVDVSHADLLAQHDAVIYAVGAGSDRTLGIEGESLAGSLAARTFVGWYNGSPGIPADAVDLSSERVVLIGNGNVALDCARILLTDPNSLVDSDIAPHALAALRRSQVREVAVVGRRTPEEAAYSRGELHALLTSPDLSVAVAGEGVAGPLSGAAAGSRASWLAGVPVVEGWPTPPTDPTDTDRWLVLVFGARPVSVLGDDEGRVSGVRLAGAATQVDVPTGLLLRSVGYRGTPLLDLPFDAELGVVPHRDGRVVDPASGEPLARTYVTGWIKRGPTGGIGANRGCAEETVRSLLEDAARGAHERRGLRRVLDGV